MLFKTIFLTLAVFIGCSLWLAYVWSDGIRTADWIEVPAMVISNDVKNPKKPVENQSWTSTVQFNIEGANHTAVVDEYLTGTGDFRIYFNPDERTQVATEIGPKFEEMIQPLIGTCLSAVLGLLLLLITFVSRKGKI